MSFADALKVYGFMTQQSLVTPAMRGSPARKKLWKRVLQAHGLARKLTEPLSGTRARPDLGYGPLTY